MYRHVFEPRAFREYDASVDWYAQRSINTAENFVKEINKTIDSICKDPYRYRNPYKKFRQASLNTYPFYIIFQ